MSLEDERAAVMQQIASLERRIDSHEGRLEALDSVPGQLAENTALTKSVADQMAQHAEMLADIAKAQVFARTVVRVVAWCGRSTKRVVVALGALAGAAYAVYVAIYALTHGGKGP